MPICYQAPTRPQERRRGVVASTLAERAAQDPHHLRDRRGAGSLIGADVRLPALHLAEPLAHAHGRARRVKAVVGARILDEAEASALGELAAGTGLGPVIG